MNGFEAKKLITQFQHILLIFIQPIGRLVRRIRFEIQKVFDFKTFAKPNLASQEEESFKSKNMNISKLNAKKVFSLMEQKKLNWNAVQTVFSYLKLLLIKLDGEEYIYWLKYLAKLISLGYGSLVMNQNLLQKRLVQMFNLSFRSFLMDLTNKNFSYTIFQISVIADLARSFPTTIYPYNKEFIQNTIKLAQFTGRNKESQTKLTMVISILYFNITQNPQIYLIQGLRDNFKHHIFNLIKKAQKQKQKNYQDYELLCKTFENIIKMNNFKHKEFLNTQTTKGLIRK